MVSLQDTTTPLNIIELGPGVGNLPLVFMKQYQNSPIKYILIDLPEALPFSISHLMYWMPEMSFVLPNELGSAHKTDEKDVDSQIVFITPQQIHEIPDNSIDFAVNTNSIAEMPSGEIEKLEKHELNNITTLNWRNFDINFDSIDNLLSSLQKKTNNNFMRRIND